MYQEASTADPESLDRMNAALADMSPTPPTIRSPETGDITLLYGLKNEAGDIQKVARVRELRGDDEEALSKVDRRRDDYYVLVEDLIIKRATESIGDIDVQKKPAGLGKLLMADKSMLFMQIMYATYGTTKEFEEVPCEACTALNDISIDIEGIIKITPLTDPEDPTILVKMRSGKKALFRYPLVEDQMAVYQQKASGTDAERNTLMIGRCIISVDGEPVQNRSLFSTKMSMADRHTAVLALQNGPGVTFKEASVPCTSCSVDIPIAFGWASLLQL